MNQFALDLITFLRKSCAPLEEKTKNGKNGEVTILFRKSGKSLCYMNTTAEKSVVTVVIGSGLKDKIDQLDISSNAKEKFRAAKQFHDGKWLFFDLVSCTDLNDIKKLILVKRAPNKEYKTRL